MKLRHSFGIAGAVVASVVIALATVASGQPDVANAAGAGEPKGTFGTYAVSEGTLGSSSLPEYDITESYVSGVSAGGYMANQLHVAHSDVFEGTGIFAAGPYYCAEGNLNTALYACMDTFMARKSPGGLVQLTQDRAAQGTVDAADNLAGDPVWLYRGTNDDTIDQAVMDDLATYYDMLGANVTYTKDTPAGHGWVSPKGTVSCSATASPYMNDCGTDEPGNMLSHLLGDVQAPASSPSGQTIQFDQNQYVPGGSASAISMGPTGFAYVPQACETESCTLMVALHGCYQYHGLIGDAFMQQAYLNEYADTNNMIVLYPQTTKSDSNPVNPRGCFNWWAYGGDTAYSEQGGKQITTIMNMVDALGGTGGTDPSPTTTTTAPTTTTTDEPEPTCVTDDNYAHTQAGRAYQQGGYTYANGSDQYLGLWNTYTESSIKESSPGYWEKC